MASPHPIRPRKLDLDFGAVPRAWFAGNAAATGIANGVNLLFPIGERFFVRSVLRHMDRLDPALQEQVRGFFGQEGRHAGAHERFFAAMRSHDYRFDRFLEIFETVIRYQEEHLPAVLSLSATAAAEHYTALLAEAVLRRRALEHAHPALRDLLLWHAAEEIEHKAVAFDALQQVNPSYAVRMAGLALASSILFSFWFAATVMLWHQDGMSPLGALRELRKLRERARAAGVEAHTSLVRTTMLRGLLQYLSPGFHPSDNDNDALAQAYLVEAGLEPAA
ncbi:metal-dependent hydrolase [Chondromyces crocatus]|uniref:Metal-dependent hydrolase n=1 Tax=Chondromyces crocatus TaxID=52 RepID=A0A0K1ET69_CHOCO|nr:metal-dependent hydrolase [Chondromyces crocatus]AKT43828.1 uncharacterized protein CMC5_080650 [Chondromyces crocatus]